MKNRNQLREFGSNGNQRLVRVYSYEAVEPDENDSKKIPKHLWEKQLTPQYDGKFLGWGQDSEQCETGVLSYTCAIVVKPDGFVDFVFPKHIQFIDETEKSELWRDLKEGEVIKEGDRVLIKSRWESAKELIGTTTLEVEVLAQRRVRKEDL